jgi:hypothetical protein
MAGDGLKVETLRMLAEFTPEIGGTKLKEYSGLRFNSP